MEIEEKENLPWFVLNIGNTRGLVRDNWLLF